MAFFNKFLKKRKTGEGTSASRPVERAREPKPEEPQKASPVRFGAASAIKRAHITEKTAAASGKGMYTFVVSRDANKAEVARAVRARYGVKISRVNILSMPGKVRRRGRQIGWRAGFKKAVVTLQEGETITM